MNLRIKDANWYRVFMWASLPISMALLITLLLCNPGDFLYSDWVLKLLGISFGIPAFVGGILSSSGYVGRFIRGLTQGFSSNRKNSFDEPLTEPEPRFKEVFGVGIGGAIGLGLAIVSLVLGGIEFVPFVSTFKVGAKALFAFMQMGSFAGWGNRIEVSVDKKNPRPTREKRFMGVAAALGFVGGLLCYFLLGAAALSVAGAATVFTGGGALLFVGGGIVFAASVSSTCASAAEYSAKACTFIRYKSGTKDTAVNKTVFEKYHEYRGSLMGIAVGLLVGLVIVTALALTHGVGLLAALFIIVACKSTGGGLGSRCGVLRDGLSPNKNKNDALSKQPEQKEQPALNQVNIVNTLQQLRPTPNLEPEDKKTSTSSVNISHSEEKEITAERDKKSFSAIIKMRNSPIHNQARPIPSIDQTPMLGLIPPMPSYF